MKTKKIMGKREIANLLPEFDEEKFDWGEIWDEEDYERTVLSLPEIGMLLTRCAEGEPAVPNLLPGIRTKLGGLPDWVEEPETPFCSSCDADMSFVAQLDSIEHFADYNPLAMDPEVEQNYMFGDSGMIYVFFCFGCYATEAVFQANGIAE
jgi:hypothetical protein